MDLNISGSDGQHEDKIKYTREFIVYFDPHKCKDTAV